MHRLAKHGNAAKFGINYLPLLLLLLLLLIGQGVPILCTGVDTG